MLMPRPRFEVPSSHLSRITKPLLPADTTASVAVCIENVTVAMIA